MGWCPQLTRGPGCGRSTGRFLLVTRSVADSSVLLSVLQSVVWLFDINLRTDKGVVSTNAPFVGRL